jgi:predicted component of type VI protein secretion system
MTRSLLTGLAAATFMACAHNKPAEEPQTRIRDTTLTPKDTTNPNDTLPHIRDSVPDSTRR